MGIFLQQKLDLSPKNRYSLDSFPLPQRGVDWEVRPCNHNFLAIQLSLLQNLFLCSGSSLQLGSDFTCRFALSIYLNFLCFGDELSVLWYKNDQRDLFNGNWVPNPHPGFVAHCLVLLGGTFCSTVYEQEYLFGISTEALVLIFFRVSLADEAAPTRKSKRNLSWSDFHSLLCKAWFCFWVQ